MFSKGASPGRVVIDTYGSESEVFSTGANTYLLDQWVFEKFKTFLSDTETVQLLKKENHLIFFLHLLGKDNY